MKTALFVAIALASVAANAQKDTSNDSNNGTDYGGTKSEREGNHTVHYVTVAFVNHEFQPNSLRAEPGDIVSFQFFPTNHSVIKAEFGYPCVPYELLNAGEEGFFSGFEPVLTVSDSNPTWNLTINSTEPVFYYCGAPGSCTEWGMVGVINANATTPVSTQIRLAKEADYVLLPGEPFPDEQEASELTSIAATATTATVTATPGPTGADSASAEATSDAEEGEGESGGDGGLGTGAIVGIVIGAVAVAVITAALFFYIGRTRNYKKTLEHKEKEEQRQSQAPGQGAPSPFMPGGGAYLDPNQRHMSGQLPPYSQTHGPGYYDARKPEEMASLSEHQMTPPLRGVSPPVGSPEMQHAMPGFAPMSDNRQYRFSGTPELSSGAPQAAEMYGSAPDPYEDMQRGYSPPPR